VGKTRKKGIRLPEKAKAPDLEQANAGNHPGYIANQTNRKVVLLSCAERPLAMSP
jgi:hypothetical protein